MPPPFYQTSGQLLSPGDIFETQPYIRVPKPLLVARKFNSPKQLKVQGELREVLNPELHTATPPFDFNSPGEEVLVNGRVSKTIFLTWGSEVEQDERHGDLHKKDWLIAPVFSLLGLRNEAADAIRAGKSPRFFPMPGLPSEQDAEYYVDFRRICPLAATHFQEVPRHWRLSPAALDDFYHQLLWFFTRKKIFFGPVNCEKCGSPVDLGVVFEGQAINPPDQN